jgi:large subunit ribosomal protein L29
MRASEIRDLPTSDILNRLEASRSEMWKLRIAFHTNTLEDPNQIRLLRKDVARMFTILRERELATAHLLAEEAAAEAALASPKARQPKKAAKTAASQEAVTANEEEKGADHGE